MSEARSTVAACVAATRTRVEFWTKFLESVAARRLAEIGVFRGHFAAQLLRACPGIEQYYMIDPWRHLDDWNKPANRDNATFESFYAEALSLTDFAADKRIVLRGTTTQVMDEIPQESLDFVYIDGDHTLRGISIDLIRSYDKVCWGGWLGGDDFSRTIWQHNTAFEPTLVFPFAVYFAEAVGAPIFAIPGKQFAMQKTKRPAFEFIDLTGEYRHTGLRDQFRLAALLKPKLAEFVPLISRISKRLRGGR